MDPVDLTVKMVGIPSVNPGSLPEGQQSAGEGAMAAFVADVLRGMGAEVEQWDALPGRPSVSGFLDLGAEETLIFDAHLDTVPVEGMTVEPFGGAVRGGRLYGRGACDVKGPAAAALSAMAAAAAAVKTGARARYNVLYAGVCDEESGFGGVRSFVARLRRESRNIAGVVVLEPTLLHPIVAHKGVIRWNITTRGVAAHSSTPHLGDNAIYKMAAVLDALAAHAKELENRPPDPQLGLPTLSVGVIQGGSAVNVVPDFCTIQVDRRLIPGESPETALADLEKALQGVHGGAVDISPAIVQAPAMAPSADAFLVELALEAARAVGAQPEVQVASYCTDGSFYPPDLGPAIVVGPGSIAQAHTKDEFIETAQLAAGKEFFLRMLLV